MKFSKQDLLTMLIGLFLFSSCKDANTIGLDLEDGVAIDAKLYDKAVIESRTEQEAPVSTVSLSRHPVGQMTDPDFGATTASTAMTLNTPSAAFKFGTNALIDSAVLILPYSTEFYGDSTQTYNVTVKQLTVDMTTKKSFLSNIVWPTNATALGNYTGILKPTTSFKITDIVAGAADTLKTVIPQMRIKLNNAFIQTNIMNLDTLILAKNIKFVDIFKGLHLSATATGKGGIMFFNFSGADAGLQIYYKKDGTAASTRDTVSTIFPIAIGTGPVAATITHDYSTTVDVKAQLANSTVQYPLTYLQGLTGLRNRITFPGIKNLKQTIGVNKVSVSKAELVIDVSPTGDAHFTAPARLSLYRYDIAGQRRNVPDNDAPVQGVTSGDPRYLGSPEAFGGDFDSVNGRYVFTVTSYVQDLIDGKTEDYGTFLAPTPFGEFNLSPSPTTAARTVLYQPKTGASATEKRLKLNIYYTKVN